MYDFAEVVLPVYPAAEGGKAGLGGRWRQWWAFLRGDAYVNPFRGWRGRTLGPGIGVTTGPYRLRTTGRRLRVNDTGITVREADGNEAHFPYSRVGLLRLSTIILVRGSGADGTHQKTLDELAFEVGAHRHTLCFRAERAEATALMTSLATWGDFHFVHQPNLEGKTQRSVSDGQNEYYAKLVYQKVSRSFREVRRAGQADRSARAAGSFAAVPAVRPSRRRAGTDLPSPLRGYRGEYTRRFGYHYLRDRPRWNDDRQGLAGHERKLRCTCFAAAGLVRCAALVY